MGSATRERQATARPAPAVARTEAPAGAGALAAQGLLQGQAIGNRAMLAMLGHAHGGPAAPALPRPHSWPAGPVASGFVRQAFAHPGEPLREPEAARMEDLLRDLPARETAAAAAAVAGPLRIADPSSAHEVAARQAAAHAQRHDRAAPAPRRPAVRRARIHADAVAAEAARALRARAFVIGDHVFFDQGRYAPHTPEGERLLLHEVVHVEQLAWDPQGLLVLRDGEGTGGTEASAVTLSVTLDNLVFDFGNRRYRPGPTRPQIWPLLLQRLLGTQYNAAHDDAIFASWQQRLAAAGHQLINDLEDAHASQIDHDIGIRQLESVAALLLIAVLEDEFHLAVELSDEQRELLRVGYALESAWPQLQPRVPRWYSEWMFRRQMADHAAAARDWQRMAPTTPGHEAYSDENRAAMIDTIFAELIGPIRVLEAIRTDYTLGNAAIDHPGRELRERHLAQAGVAWRVLWQFEGPPTRRVTSAPSEDRVQANYALLLLNFVHTQPVVGGAAAAEGADGHANRLELLGRFQRLLGRAASRLGGDERLFNEPAHATDPPWRAQMTSTPPLAPPTFEAALETDHAFTMQLEFGTVFDAFAFYGYLWKFVRIPDPSSGEAVPDPLTAAGTRPSFGAVWDTRLSRAHRYNAADLERIRSRFGSTPWGEAISAASFADDLVRLNNVLRTLGTVIRTVLERLTQPRNTTRIVFPEPGMYVVVCRAVPVLEGDEEVTHAPSVAMLPVVARDPDEMAVARVREASRNEFQMELRISEIRALLDSPIPPENAADLQAELRELQGMLAEPGAALQARRQTLTDQIAVLQRRLDLRQQIAAAEAAQPPNPDELASLRRALFEAGGELSSAYSEREDMRGLQRQLDTIGDMITMREGRAASQTGARFSPHATFVSDLGATLELALEVYDDGVVDGEYRVYISDLTTPDSGATDQGRVNVDNPPAGYANVSPRVAAIEIGLKDLLESHSDYGRGRVAIEIEQVVYTVRIEAGTGRMLMEGVENGVQVLSLAAIVAAPFTAGESLALLLPLGAIGAIPSAYRLMQRYDENRLRFDLATAMDVLNIVGSVIGLAQAATPLRMVRLGRVLMVAGLGADGAGMMLMETSLVLQIEALGNLPEHERAAQLASILGGAMLQIGIQAGGMLMHARYQGARESGGPVREGGVPRDAEPTGFRPPAETGAGTPPVEPATRAPADRTTAGAPPPTPPRRGGRSAAPARPSSVHERLLARFESGIDYARPPPAADVANPPPAGTYRRRLRSDDAAFRAYNDAVAVSQGREVGLFHNPRTGEYRVMIGDETGVSAPGRAGWDAVVHYHPDGGTRVTFRLPSPHDFQGLMFRYLETGAAVREFVEFDIPGVGRGRTEYGIEPGSAEPFYVRIHRPNEAPQTLRFAHDGAFSAYWGERTVFVEPGSPLYEAMVRDIQDYVRSLDPAQAGAPPPTGRGEAGAPQPTGEGARPEGGTPAPQRPATAGRSTAGAGDGSGRMTDAGGNLTDLGVAYIRRTFRDVREFGGGRSRRTSLDNLTDAQIRERFPNEWQWLQAVVTGEARQSWIGRTTATDFLLAEPRQSLFDIANRLEQAVTAGGTGHTVDRAVLGRNAYDFIRELVNNNDPTLRPLWDALEASTNPAVRRAWDRYLFGDVQVPGRTQAARNRARQQLLDTPNAGGQGVGRGRVGDKEPDMVEVVLSQDALHVLDPSQRWSDPVHNFKSALYEAALRRLIDVATVTSTDVGSGGRMRPAGQ